jgi:hypothetical protein
LCLWLGDNIEILSMVKTSTSLFLTVSTFNTIDIKDFGATKYILGMEVKRNRINKKIWLSQSKYVKFVLQQFHMADCRPLSVSIYVGTKISIEQCPTTPIEMEDMTFVSYASVVGSL